jgi:hypothetical protein
MLLPWPGEVTDVDTLGAGASTRPDLVLGKMTNYRPVIPAALERDLMIEAGYRCAVCKGTDALEIDHIVEWVEVQKHEFENLIVLCPNCHARKQNTNAPRHINRLSLQRIKSNLMMLNARYSDLERRIIETFQEGLAADPNIVPSVMIPSRLGLLVKYIVRDGFVTTIEYQSAMTMTFPDGTVLQDNNLKLTLTAEGRRFIDGLTR